jgi:hypothetical protein
MERGNDTTKHFSSTTLEPGTSGKQMRHVAKQTNLLDRLVYVLESEEREAGGQTDNSFGA